MHRLNELAAKLTLAQVKEVEDFAEFLLARGQVKWTEQPKQAAEKKQDMFKGWEGCLAGVEPEKSDKQLIREAWDSTLDKIE